MSLPGRWTEGVQDQCVTRELNTLLTALYVLIDDHVVEARAGRGRAPLLSDSELITLAVAQMLQGYHCERRWIRHIRSSPKWREMFPYLPVAVGLSQAAEKRPPVAVQSDPHPGRLLPILV